MRSLLRSPAPLLLLIPVAVVSNYATENAALTFVTAALSIIPLAWIIGRATEQLAMHVGARLGSILNATLGNVAELIIGIFLVLRGEFDVVKASLTGSILGNLLLVLGAAMFLGGVKRQHEQTFDAPSAHTHSKSLMLAVIGLLMPALFIGATRASSSLQREVVSASIGIVLVLMYLSALAFTFVTHQHLFRSPESDETPTWTKQRALVVLLIAAAVTAFQSEMLTGSLESAAHSLGLSKLFVGLILVPIIGNAAEHGTAVLFAMRDRMDIAIEIAFGSSTQIALLVAPLLVFIGLITGHPMDFVFTVFEIAAVALSAVIVVLVTNDGKSNWLEGVQLIGAYAIMAISAFFVN